MMDKEIIRAEVEKMYEVVTKDYSLEGVASAAQLHKILVFIDSLSKKQASKDLEEAAIEYCGGNKGAAARVRAGFIMGANWQKKQMIDKACQWLRITQPILPDTTIERFRKAMEEEK